MVTKILKWGNSLGLRIPSAFAKETGVSEGSEVDITVEDDRIVVRPVKRARYRLADLTSKIREDNIHEEIPTGDPKGRESW